jgi:hypothetical protein
VNDMKSSGVAKYGEFQPYIDILKELEQRQVINNVDVDYDDNYYDGGDELRTTFNVVDPDDPETVQDSACVELVIDAVDSWVFARDGLSGYCHGNEHGDSVTSFKNRLTFCIRNIVSEFTPFGLSDESFDSIYRAWSNRVYATSYQTVTMDDIYSNLPAAARREITEIAVDYACNRELILAYIIKKACGSADPPEVIGWDNDNRFALGFTPGIKKWAKERLTNCVISGGSVDI